MNTKGMVKPITFGPGYVLVKYMIYYKGLGYGLNVKHILFTLNIPFFIHSFVRLAH